MPGEETVEANVPCGHPEIAERWVTSDSELVFCMRCQRGYEIPPNRGRIDAEAEYVRAILAYVLP